MKYVFEDNLKSALSQLYIKAFPLEISRNFIFTKSSSNLRSAVIYCLDKLKDDVAVFIDLVEDNNLTVKTFMDLWEIQINNAKLRVVPLICSEYYFLASVKESSIVKDFVLLQRCLYSECHWLDTKWRGKLKHTSFEAYCKHTVKHALFECASKSGKCRYLCEDCLCDTSYTSCIRKKLAEKAIEYVSAYPIFPVGLNLPGNILLNNELYESYIINRITRHNNRVKIYSKLLGDEVLENLIETDSKGWPVLQC